MPASKLARLITAKEANHLLFNDMARLLEGVLHMMEEPQQRQAAVLALKAVAVETCTIIPAERLGSTAAAALSAIRDAVVSEESSAADVDPVSSHHLVPAEFVAANEKFRNKIRRPLVTNSYDEVDAAFAELAAALESDLQPVVLEVRARQEGKAVRNKTEIVYDVHNNATWLKGTKTALSTVIGDDTALLIHPKDRNGKSADTRYSTWRVEEALFAYRRAAYQAEQVVAEQLRCLAGRLEGHLPELVGAAVFGMVVRALVGHVNEALRRRWTLPELGPEPATGESKFIEEIAASELAAVEVASAEEFDEALVAAAAAASSGGSDSSGRGLWRVEGVWPYWMDGNAPSTVLNSVESDGMILLTGPNMAGKSTIARTLLAVALLANCGLYVPARWAAVPRFDAFMVRMGASDSPAAGKSAFAVEMSEAHTIIRDATAHSLVMVDELCKGTEVTVGTTLAAAILEELERTGCRGIFATHLHSLFALPLHLPSVTEMCMQIRQTPDGVKAPTWQIVPGRCFASLALETAADCHLAPHIIERAAALLEKGAWRVEDGAAGIRSSGQESEKNAVMLEAREGENQLEGSSAPQADPEAELSDNNSGRSIEQALEVLREVSYGMSEGGTADHGSAIHYGMIRAGQAPPPMVVGRACVYVVRYSKGWFYCGETDDLAGRVRSHRSRAAQRGAEIAFAALPSGSGGKSSARSLEAQMIRAVQAAGFPMRSVSDSRHKHFANRDTACSE
ncbi:DNA mismatch repair ATPase msh1 [Cymbomonas tetramitiformis]|uniref:DNA mismatch repair ATPase msh1 n=1 Tax=Cymbomonas tetramitiformis TaxID=36881 RepID=A0AAE0KXE0_9CHLO|nr:DNA mismatch repair ATPase msh1 [Cymbomonas tetramitiformis]